MTMKKTLSLIMAIAMILSMSMISVYAEDILLIAPAPSAPEGTAITSAAEFAAMDPAGTYYLANDITIAEPYATAFTGTIDGNGKTVTISVPMFVDFGGKIKNLVLEGSVTALAAEAELPALAENGARGSIACYSTCGTEVVFENIVNNASIAAIGNLASDDCAGGILGKFENETGSVKFINCENNGVITGMNQVGGILGWAKKAASVTFETCWNNGEIKENVANAYSAGIVCRSDAELTTFIGCVNNAKVSSGKDQAGGMLAYASKGSFVFESCANYGEIAPTIGKAGGLFGNINCNDADGKTGYFVTVTSCVNYGKITAGGDGNYGAGIASTVQKTLNFTITQCLNYGEINGTHDSGGIVGHTTQAVMNMSFCENHAKVTTTSDQYAGGICGYAWGTKTESVSAVNGDYANKIEYCINHGEVVADTRAGGICGSTGTSNARGISLINYCLNTANVTTNGTKDNFSLNTAGGILGYGYGTEDVAYPAVTNCLTTGNVTAKNTSGAGANAAYFLGYVNSSLAVVTGNQALGTLTSESGNITSLARNEGQEFKAENMTKNSIPADAAYAYTYENTITDKKYEVSATNAAEIASGKLVYGLNLMAKAMGAPSDVVFMTLDGSFAPTLVPEIGEGGLILNAVVANADGTFSNPTPVKPVEPAPTGDSALIYIAVAVISIATLGVAAVAKKREN